MSSKSQVRDAFRSAVYRRDKHTCQVCGKKWTERDADPNAGKMNAHHITDRSLMPNGGYVAENGITVCDGGPGSCHMRCEQWHISGHTQVEAGLHPSDLYAKIGSSYEKAVAASEKLSTKER